MAGYWVDMDDAKREMAEFYRRTHMARKFEVEAVTSILLKWAQNKGVRSYVTDDEANDLAIEVIDELDDARTRAERKK